MKTLLFAFALFASVLPQAHAQAYPAKPIRIIVPQPPGGGFDTVARLLADRMGKQMNQSFIVENKAGSGTLIGTDAAAKSAPDGYTLLARKDLAQKSLKEVMAHAKANPDKLYYASGGNGSGQHVLAAALWHLAGVQVAHVPYRGAQAAYQDLLGGRVDLFFDLSSTARAQVDAGNVRALAVSGAARNPMHPDVPTVTKTGTALEFESWFGLFAPARTPPAILERLRTDFARVAASPELQEAFAKAGGNWLSRPPEQPFDGKPVAIMGASPGMVGTARVQYHLRQVLLFMNTFTLNKPEVFINQAASKFSAEGELIDPPTAKVIGELLAGLESLKKRLG
ncbi:tripartite tricarboxylate transporter substrate-binding protein [Ramlibacter sp. WS9]|uniref:tripartite tricarboxylate transporter substrate-binding protein n=1 Tax=Ramlibacter sp. WS9 TaxID=1882741 RepID=UPI001143542F|nr:tripartite tricarboxylate transporter substrate-binding protein [Ramlibacter sp. WS9]ROZ79673.1 tripartite tricarboxylate transporter substrate binding protein [Ramlibacter sp. WS9]